MRNPEYNRVSKTILVVDEDPHYRLRLQELVSGWGHLALTCRDMSSALKALKSGIKADVAIVGTDPGDANQSHFLALLRERAPLVPVILCSSDLRVGTYLRATSLGVFECLEKTVHPRELRRVVLKALDKMNSGVSAFPGASSGELQGFAAGTAKELLGKHI